ncbi:hypothetical protein DSL99_105 [Leeuwenhoekiella marinoflava]|uniref:Uncharacterized protein n=1 Tax=Leeuwenhoekiella marinoflava TaxID=988 RepID=A0A4Q0PRW9_9FLAO|nr:hypothetical protein DSL99_105 [Leeuwenhoekiella marinoflava]
MINILKNKDVCIKADFSKTLNLMGLVSLQSSNIWEDF